MKTITIIINGTHLPYHVVHYAIEKAKEDSCEIFALFLKGKHDRSEGYIFPSDISTVEKLVSEKKLCEDEMLISDNMNLIQRMVEDEKIPYRSTLKTNATIDEVAGIAKMAQLVIIDADFDHPSLLKDNKVSMKALKQKIGPINIVAEENNRGNFNI